MSRREALGILVVAGLILLGRLLRRFLLMDPHGVWRESGWLEEHLPPLAQDPPPRPSRPGPPTTPQDPNTCPADSLVRLPGIGPAIAGRIVAARAEGVHFACARDLQAIRGIGRRTVERIEPYLYFLQQDTASSSPSH